MAGNGYLRTVNFGGFDKKDVLAYVDELNTKIYNLETQLGEKNDTIAALEASGAAASSGDFEGKEILEKQIEDSHKKIEETNSKLSELMASTDSLKLQLSNAENETAEKDTEIASLKNEIEDLKQKLSDAEANAAAGGSGAAFDMSAFFMEAQKSANAAVTQAKENAKKMEEDAKALQDQILEDANTQAAKIVANANAEAKNTTDTARAQADAAVAAARANADNMIKDAKAQESQILAQSKGLRDSVRAEYTALDGNLQKLSAVLNDLLGDSIVKVDSAKGLVSDGLKLVDGNSNFNYSQKGSDAQKVNKTLNTNNINSNKYDYTAKTVEPVKTAPAAPQAKAEPKQASSSDDIFAQLAAQALAAVESSAKTAPAAKSEEKTTQQTSEKPTSSIGRSLQFRDPAPDSVKPAVKKEEPKVEAPMPKPEPVKQPEIKAEVKPEVKVEVKPEVKLEAKVEEKSEPKMSFHMVANDAPVEDEPKPVQEKHQVSGLSMTKTVVPSEEPVKQVEKKSPEATGLRMTGGAKSKAVNSRDADMMASLAKDIQSNKEEVKSDEDILNDWRALKKQ